MTFTTDDEKEQSPFNSSIPEQFTLETYDEETRECYAATWARVSLPCLEIDTHNNTPLNPPHRPTDSLLSSEPTTPTSPSSNAYLEQLAPFIDLEEFLQC